MFSLLLKELIFYFYLPSLQLVLCSVAAVKHSPYINHSIYPPELQLNKANTSDTEAPFLDLHLSISNGFVSSKIYDKRDDFDFDLLNFPIFGWWRSLFYLLRGLHSSPYSVC